MRCSTSTPRSRRHESSDRGITLVEILVSVVLISTAVIATLTTLRISIIGGTVHRDHSNAHAWLQSASDRLYAEAKEDCNTTATDHGKSAIIAKYQTIVDRVDNPEDWANWQIEVIDVKFWNARRLPTVPPTVPPTESAIVTYSFGTDCQDSINLTLQQLTLEVRSPNGRIIEKVELIK